MLYEVIDRETISSVSSSIGFTTSQLTTSVLYAIIQAIDAAIRFCIDGTTPVADTTGIRLTKDDSVEIWGMSAMKNFRCIDDGGTAKVEVIFLGRGG